ncbi:MAG: phosphotransferase [Caldilineaceae bacterium]
MAVPGHADLLLRAYQQPRTCSCLNSITAPLSCAFGRVRPFPLRVQRTVVGETVGEAYGWSTLLWSYIEGEAATGTVAEFQQLGRVLAQLHSVDGATATAAQPALPPCRWQPWQKVIGWYTNLAQVADDVPTELAALCQFSLNILAQVGQWSAMPNTLLHGDPNHVNAVRTGIADRTAPTCWY